MTETRKEFTYTEYLSIGFRYLQTQKNHLLFNLIILAILLLAQLINWFFIINVPANVRPQPLEVHTPLFILFIISIILIWYVFYLYKLLVQLTKYKELESKKENGFKFDDDIVPIEELEQQKGNSTSITETLYIIDEMINKLQLLFITTLVFSFIYLLWFIRFFIQDLTLFEIITLSSPRPPPIGPTRIPPPPPITRLFNYITILALFLFLLTNLRYYLNWHRKFANLEELEKKIYDELDLDS